MRAMSTDGSNEGQGASAAIRGLQLLGLCSFAIAQPLYDVLARHASFLVVRKVSSPEILVLATALLLVPPLLLWLVEFVSGLVSHRLVAGVHTSFVALLLALIFLPILKKVGLVSPLSIFLLAGFSSVGLVLAYSHVAALRIAVSALGIASLLFAGLFVADPSILRLVLRDANVDVNVEGIDSKVPVVMLVLDELPLSSLLDASGEVDDGRYPSIARLASQSTWFRNTTSVDWRTLQVIPAMLTGMYPGETKKLPVAFDHPRNLFALFEEHYDLNVIETHTQLYELDASEREPAWLRARALYSDLYYVYLHVLLPSAMAEKLPSVTRTWKDFGKPLGGDYQGQKGMAGRPGHFRRFLKSIRVQERPALHFLHIMLPHSPWHYLPSGKAYTPFQIDGFFMGGWVEEPWWGMVSYQRHLLQLEFLDTLIGELIDHLERIDLWDRSLVLVTADHGVTFWPDQHFRDLGEATHPEDILNVPLFIKRPGQRSAETKLRHLETVDILPTLLDALGVAWPWEIDGCSGFDADCGEREEITAFTRTSYFAKTNRRLVFPKEVLEGRETLDRKIHWFGEGGEGGEAPPEKSLHRFGPHATLVGRRIAELRVQAAAGEVRIEKDRGFKSLDPSDRALPVRISGTLHLDGGDPTATPHVAVALGGIVQTVVPAPRDGLDEFRELGYVPDEFAGFRVSAMLPEQEVRHGERPELFLVEGTADEVVLAPLRIVGSGG